jgi:phosphoribosylanthranilate isomerase
MTDSDHIKIKVCGMRDAENIVEVGSLGPDYMGFIFYRDSPRYVGVDFQIPPDLPASAKRVGVFVNESVEEVIKHVKKYRLDFVQLHGDESVEICQKLNDAGTSIIKVFRVDDEFDFTATSEFSEAVDYFLFDTKGKNYGGNAKKFNWHVLNKYTNQIPFFLSGGIDAESVSDILALKDLNLHAIDVNSGVESAPGLKDVKKVSAIINSLRYEL